jgi:hypothetical protein
MADLATSGPPRTNRFARHKKTTIVLTVIAGLALIEAASYVVIAIKGHQDLRFQYRYNRILSGYTVFENVPNHSFRTSAIKTDPSEPAPVLDAHGFLCDAPVSRQKPPGTFRIVLLGGSAAFGAGQNVRYHSVHPYPDGVYSYPSSIAGRLKAYLSKHGAAGVRYEVINAAGFERRIHQSFLQYVSSIAPCHPDLVISLEGMNDVYSVVSGTPFDDVEQQLPFYVELYQRPHSLLNYSATYYVLSAAYDKWRNRAVTAETSPGDHVSAKTQRDASPAAPDPGRAQYQRDEPRFRKNAERLLQITRQYFAVLQADRTRLLFVLQPLLHRRKVNKQLSETEQRLARVLVPAAADPKSPVDENALVLMYAFDDFLSEAFHRAAEEHHVGYIDINAEITGLGPEVEFFTDYCHLTPDANDRVAQILGRAILAAPAKPKPGAKP